MAIPATGRARGAHGVADAVNAGRVLLAFLFVTNGAVGRRQVAIVNRFLDAVMAIHAGKFRVNGVLERMGREQEGDVLPVHLARRIRVEVAVQTVAVLDCLGRASRAQARAQKQKENEQADGRSLYGAGVPACRLASSIKSHHPPRNTSRECTGNGKMDHCRGGRRTKHSTGWRVGFEPANRVQALRTRRLTAAC